MFRRIGKMATLYIIRGISGSGKTTLASKMAAEKNCRHLEADMWFMRGDGEYIFDFRELDRAHNWCFNEACVELNDGRDVIVSNTFTRLWEMRNYIDFATERGHKVQIITCNGRYQNVHGLSEGMVAKQAARFQSNAQIAAELKHDWNRYGKIVYVNH
jgi:predicted kinase